MSDPYYAPEKFDLVTVGEVEWTEPCYSFDLTVVWRHKDGRLFWASDEGCSCPSPFENYTALADLQSGSAFDLHDALQERHGDRPSNPIGAAEWDRVGVQIVDLMSRVRSGVSS